jgi:hypothetical protein
MTAGSSASASSEDQVADEVLLLAEEPQGSQGDQDGEDRVPDALTDQLHGSRVGRVVLAAGDLRHALVHPAPLHHRV